MKVRDLDQCAYAAPAVGAYRRCLARDDRGKLLLLLKRAFHLGRRRFKMLMVTAASAAAVGYMDCSQVRRNVKNLGGKNLLCEHNLPNHGLRTPNEGIN